MSEDIKITRGSGNVFADIGLPNAEELSIKSQLAINLELFMKRHKLTQKQVAEMVGSDQPTISKVLRGKLHLVTTDRLLAWHKKLDQDVRLTITDRFKKSGRKADGAHVGVI